MKYFLFLALGLASCTVAAQQRAVTDEGKVVILASDGTWHFEQAGSTPDTQITIDSQPITKDSSLNFAVRSTKNNSIFWIDPTKWTFKKSPGNTPSEYSFQMKDSDLYAMAVTEGIQIDLEHLANLALTNAKNAGPDSRIVKKEIRTVNGQKVLYMEMVGTIQGITFEYLGYYVSGPGGTTQFLVYTAENLVPKYQSEIAKFLNGLAVDN